MHKRTLPAIAGIAAVAALLTGCQSPGSSAESGGDGEAMTAITLGVAGQPPIFQTTVLQVAVNEGFFTDEGLDVTLRPFTTGVDVGRAIQSGELEGGMTITQGAAAIRSNGGSIVGVLGFEHPSYTLVSADPSVTACEDVAGKTVATDSPGTPLNLALSIMLESCGLTLDDITSVAVNGTATLDAVLAKQVDIAVLHPEQIAIVAEDRPIEALTTVAEVDPLSHYMLLATTDKALADEESREKWVKIVRAMKSTIDFMYDDANSDAVAEAAAEITTRELGITSAALPDYKALEMWPATTDGMAQDRIEATIAAEVTAGNIEEAAAPTFDELVDPSVYKDAVSD